MRLDRVIEAGSIRVVGIRELRNEAARVAREVVDGERTIITRHLAPCGVLLSVRDMIEIALSLFLAERAADAAWEEREGALEDPFPEEVRPCQIQFSMEAKREFDELTLRQQAMVKALVRRAKPLDSSPQWTVNGRWLVGFDMPGPRLATVYAVLDGWEAEDLVLGAELRGARDRQDVRRSARMRGGGASSLSRARRGS